jgi:DNA-binding IclR family transcriptional regulator
MKTKIRMKANGEPDRRELRRGLKLDAAIAALRSQKTIEELATAIGCDRRTVYRVIRDLEARRVYVARSGARGRERYFLAR